MKLLNTNNGAVVVVNNKMRRVRHLQRRVKSWADLLNPYLEKLGVNYRLVMITLTYTGVDDWRANHIREFMLKAHKILGVDLLAYAWVAELQKRGAVHYHVLLLVNKGTKIPVPDKTGWWVHGATKIETARSPFYILSYTNKKFQKFGNYPKGLRVFAVWIREGVLSNTARWLFRLSALPVWLSKAVWQDCNFNCSIKRVPGGGWECGGYKYFSPWEVLSYD